MNIKFFLPIIFISLCIVSCKDKTLAKLPPEEKKTENKPLTQPLQKQMPMQTPTLPEGVSVHADSFIGTVIGVQTSQLSFHNNGYISAVYVRNGQYVKKGQAIAKQDDSIAYQQLQLAKLASTQAEITQHYAELSLKRNLILSSRQANTKIAFEQAESNFKNAQVAFKQALANQKIAQINYDNTTLTAPFEGYLFGLTLWEGSFVSSTNIISTISSTKDLQIQIPVPQTVKNTFTIGDVFPFSNPEQNLKGLLKITSVVPFVDMNTKSYIIYGVPTKINGQLMSGQLVVADLSKH